MSSTHKSPIAQLFTGEDAYDEFTKSLDSMMEAGARGETVIMIREGCHLRTRVVNPMDLAMGLPDSCEMIVLDGASAEGESWKTTYHPEQGVCTVVHETPDSLN